MGDFFAMGGYAAYVWTVYGLGLVTLIYNTVSARRRLRNAMQQARTNAQRSSGRPQPIVRIETGQDA